MTTGEDQSVVDEELNTLISTIPVGIVVYRVENRNVKLVRTNDIACELLDVNPKDVYSKNQLLFQENVHPDDYKFVFEKMCTLGKPNTHIDFSFRYRKRSGSFRKIKITANTILTTNNIVMSYGILQDETEVEEAREALTKSQQKYEQAIKSELAVYRDSLQSMLSANPNALCAFQFNFTKNECSAVKGTSSFSEQTLQSKTVDGLIRNIAAIAATKQDKDLLIQTFDIKHILDSFDKGITNISLEYRRRNEKGNIIWVKTYLSLLRNPETKDVTGVIYSLDITQDKIRKDVFKIITNEEYDYVALLYEDTQEIEFLNMSDKINSTFHDKLSLHTRFDFEKIRQFTANSWIDEADRDLYLRKSPVEEVKKELDSLGHCEINVRGHYVNKPGMMCRKIQHYYLDNEKDVILIVQSDVTEIFLRQQEEVERETILKKKALAANEAKSKFLSQMSHDIRTPLNGIIGMTRIAHEQDNGPKTNDCLNKIETSSKFLLGLINDVLDVAKIESGEVKLHISPYQPREFFDYLNSVIKPLCEAKHQTFVIGGNANDDYYPLLDKLRVNQIVFNLLSNAVKYTPEGGKVEYILNEEIKGDKMIMTVIIKDNGIGMSKEFQKKLFKSFMQENRSKDVGTINNSTGLGLSIVKSLLDLMGGTISVESEIDKGSTFTMVTPVGYVSKKDYLTLNETLIGNSKKNLAGKHVLVFEDNYLNQEVTKAILEDASIVVDVAGDGQKGVTMFAESSVGYYAAVLMDLRMPVMDGYEAARKIRAMDRIDAVTVPIIAMTADAYDTDIQKCLSCGMDAHVAKPIEPDKLFEALAQFVHA